MKKVLVITYYWPPSGGAGVQRWMRFVKNLRSFGWEPVIYRPANAIYPVSDPNLQKYIPEGVEVWEHNIVEPNNLFSAFQKGKNNEFLYKNQQQKAKKSFVQKLLWYIRGNFFIPDARAFWVKPSVKYLKTKLSSNQIDAIVSTGPPHTTHLIAQKLKKDTSIPWLSDFRDPWTTMDYLQEMSLSKRSWKKHFQMEKEVITQSDCVVAVGRTIADEYLEKYGVKTEVIHNGFEHIDYQIPDSLDEDFTIVHIGSLTLRRDCPDLWRVLSKLVKSRPEFKAKLKIRLVGKVDPIALKGIDDNGLSDYLDLVEYVPFEKTQEYLFKAQLLLLSIDRIPNAEFVLTGKMFEYLKSHRPILLIGPKPGDAEAIVSHCEAGYCCQFENDQEIENAVLDAFSKFQNGTNTINSKNIDDFSGRNLTKKLVECLNTISK